MTGPPAAAARAFGNRGYHVPAVPELRPFRGLRYDRRAVPDASAVLCPPYDVISPAQREALAARDPRNAVHVELPVPYGGEDSYAHAARIFAGWQSDGTLVRDQRPLIYPYDQRSVAGDDVAARGFFCLLRLEPLGRHSSVRPHERTRAAPKEDRYRLLEAVRANLSPVVLLYQSDGGHDGSSARLLEELMSGPPATVGEDDDGLRHRLWAADPEMSAAARRLLALASAAPLTIADGHHRYETALRFQASQAGASSAAAADFVLVLLYDAYSGGLNVLPTHRTVRGVPSDSSILAEAAKLFRVTEVHDGDELPALLSQPGRIGIWTRTARALLEPRAEAIDELLPATASEAVRRLDVTILDSVLRRLVGRSAEALLDGGDLSYTRDARAAVASVRAGEADACFLVPPTPVSAVLEVAAGGQQMPHKSTYFHPKAATGLVFNTLSQ